MRTRNSPSAGRTAAFTLVELLVAIVLILILATLAVMFVPRINESEKANRASGQIQGDLLLAKQRALRDRLPTGIRLGFTQGALGSPGALRDFQFIQQPDDFRGTSYEGYSIFTQAGPLQNYVMVGFPNVRFFNSAIGGANSPDRFVVMPGDYVEFFGGGILHQIQGILQPAQFPAPFNGNLPNGASFPATGSVLILSPGSQATLPGPAILPTQPLPPPQTAAYRIIRQPRVIENEEPITLPQDVAIDLSLSINIPSRLAYSGTGLVPGVVSPQKYFYYDILFAPSGAIVGQGTGSGNIILYVRDMSRDSIIDGDPRLVTILTHTGLVAVHPIDPSNPPSSLYNFTHDARSSGL